MHLPIDDRSAAPTLAQFNLAFCELSTGVVARGAVNLYDTERFANQKQRDMACMVSPVCAFPGCRHGAYASEIHHVDAWKHGGLTNMDNLVPLCRYHNRINDDDPWRNKRGRIAMIRGAPWWVSPRGYHIKNTDRGALDQLFGPQST